MGNPKPKAKAKFKGLENPQVGMTVYYHPIIGGDHNGIIYTVTRVEE